MICINLIYTGAKMRLFVVTIIASISFSAFSYAQNVLTLNDAINIALQRNTTVQKAENTIKTYESNLKSSYGNLLPSINASGSWNWTHSVAEGGSFNIGNIVINTPEATSETRNYSAGVDASWTLFDGLSNIATLNQSKSNLEAYRMTLERTKQDIIFQTMSNYYSVISSQQLMKVQQEDVAWNKKNLETVEERNKLGAVTMADVYSAQVQEGNAELSLIQAQNTFETNKSNLLYYLGLNVLDSYKFNDTLTTKEQDILNSDLIAEYNDLSGLVDQALKNRLDYKSAQLSLESAQYGVTIAKSGYLPMLTNSLSYGLRANQLSQLTKTRTYSAGLTLSIPIFSGFSTENSVETAEVNVENQKLDLDDLKRQRTTNLQKTYLDLQAAEKALEVNKRNVESNNENRETQQEKYSLGSSTILDVLIANANYITAKINFINSEFNYIQLAEQLKYYLGELNVNKSE
jgi:outer membrane protein